jgi:hypothetical protein
MQNVNDQQYETHEYQEWKEGRCISFSTCRNNYAWNVWQLSARFMSVHSLQKAIALINKYTNPYHEGKRHSSSNGLIFQFSNDIKILHPVPHPPC